jgi:hypothetical protein
MFFSLEIQSKFKRFDLRKFYDLFIQEQRGTLTDSKMAQTVFINGFWSICGCSACGSSYVRFEEIQPNIHSWIVWRPNHTFIHGLFGDGKELDRKNRLQPRQQKLLKNLLYK